MVLIVFGLLAVLSIGFATVCYVVIDNPELIAPPPPVRTANSPPEYVIGDLGGMPVKIDHRIVQFIEYDGDPGWGERRRGPRPQRTYSSRLSSFAFEVRYPDMKTRADKDAQADYEKYHPLSSSLGAELRWANPWIGGGIRSGSRYPGHGAMDRLYQATTSHPETRVMGDQLVPIESEIPGLELFVDLGAHPTTGESWRYSSIGSGDTYFHRDSSGRPTTYINCKFRSGTRRYSLCQHEWSLESLDLNIWVSTLYPPGLLPHWQDIQIKVSQFILTFQHTQTTGPVSPPANIHR